MGNDGKSSREEHDLKRCHLVTRDAVSDERDQKERDWKDERDSEAAFEGLTAESRAEPLHQPLVQTVNRHEIGLEWRHAAEPLLQRHAVVVARELEAQGTVWKGK